MQGDLETLKITGLQFCLTVESLTCIHKKV
jgi:hypothetical protein